METINENMADLDLALPMNGTSSSSMEEDLGLPGRVSPMEGDNGEEDVDALNFLPLEMDEVRESLLSPVPMDLLPSVEGATVTPDIPMPITPSMGTETGCDSTSLPSSCCLSDNVDNLSLISAST